MRRTVTRRACQALSVALLCGSATMLMLPSAHATGDGTAGTPLLQQAWYWQNAYEQANPPVAEAAPTTEPSGVPDGDLAVAYTGNADKSPSKMLALSWDLSAVPSGVSVEQFTFSLTMDTQSGATSFNASGAPLVACQPTRLWPALMGGDYTNEPTVDCSKKVTPTVSGDTYTFKIPTIAQSWFDDQNLGVALVPDPAATVAPFQVVFKGAKSSHGTLTYLPPVSTPAGSTSSGSSSAVGAGAANPAAPAPAGPAPAALPPAASDVTGSGAAPPVVASSQPAAPTTRAVANVRPAPAMPTGAFWLAGVVIAVVLLVSSLVLGDPVPAQATASRSRLLSVRSL